MLLPLAARWMSVTEFKAHCRSKFSQQTPPKPIFAEKTETLKDVIKKMDDGQCDAHLRVCVSIALRIWS